MSKQTIQIRITGIVVAPVNDPMFSEMATTVEIADDAAGKFVEVSQSAPGLGEIAINPEEWPSIRAAINRMIKHCRDVP